MQNNINISATNELLGAAAAEDGDTLSPEQLSQLLTQSGINVELSSNSANQNQLNKSLFLQIKNTREFGITIRAGLTADKAKLFGDSVRAERAFAVAATDLSDEQQFLEQLKNTIAYQILVEQTPEQDVSQIDEQLLNCLSALFILANYYSPGNTESPFVIEELTIGQLTLNDNYLMVRSGSCRIARAIQTPNPRPIEKIGKILHPETIGIIGVSATKMNFGRIILKNLIGSGYAKENMTIIRPEETEIDGVKCVDNLQALTHKLDLFIVAVAADAVFDLVDEVIETNAAESVMLIPGGLGETERSREPAAAMSERINQAHARSDGGPIFIGGNCLGVVSHAGGYDSWFIPRERLPKPQKKQRRNSALISQSGAFMITRISKNPWLDPAYMTALGNQSDITHGDMINYFADNDDIDTIGIYIEGFKDLDGLNFTKAVQKAVINGKQVVVYKAGRTDAGKIAARGHTASDAGDYELCETLLTQAGALVANSFTEFDDLLYIADRLHHKTIGGSRLAAVSGAGFETVGMADSVSASLTMAPLSATTKQRLEEILIAKRLDALMEVRNPIDINPGADDEAHVQCTLAFAEDPEVDAVVVGLDPMAPSMRTLAECKSRPGFDINDEKSVVRLLPQLVDAQNKPIIGIVDGGPLYDAMSEKLMDQGVCVFRSCERGVKALARYISSRLRAEKIKETRG